MPVVVSESTLAVMQEYLEERRELFKSICKKFETKYGNVDNLRKKIEEEGVPEDDHTRWDDLIEWENALSELERIESILKGLKS